MENVRFVVDDELFDRMLSDTLKDKEGSVVVVVKDRGTKHGKPCVGIFFETEAGNVQTVMTARLFCSMASHIQAHFPQLWEVEWAAFDST